MFQLILMAWIFLYLFHGQVQDYGCLIKMDNGEDILNGQVQLLKVFLLLDGKSSYEYQGALVASVCQWLMLKAKGHPVWVMFEHNASAFNEESGEIAFSSLARGISRGGVRSELSDVKKRFVLLKSKMQMAEDLMIDLHGDDFGTSSGREIQQNSAEVKKTLAFCEDLIDRMLAGRYRWYDDTLGRTTGNSERKTVAATQIANPFQSVSEKAKDVVAKVKKQHSSFWVFSHSEDIWPLSKPQISDDSEDEIYEPDQEQKLQTPERKRSSSKQNEKNSENKHSEGEQELDMLVKFTGRLLSIPAQGFGMRWARQTYGNPAYKKARLIFRIQTVAKFRSDFKCVCYHVEDPDYTKHIPIQEARRLLVHRRDESSAKDTPALNS